MARHKTLTLQLSSGKSLRLTEGVRVLGADLKGSSTSAAAPFAEVGRNPQDPSVLGLKNLTTQTWMASIAAGKQHRVAPGRHIRLASGTTLQCGSVSGTIQEHAGQFRLRIPSGQTLPLQDGAQISAQNILDILGEAAAEVVKNPKDPTILGLKNLTLQTWQVSVPDGSQRQVESGQSIRLTAESSINFGSVVGHIAASTPDSQEATSRETLRETLLDRLGPSLQLSRHVWSVSLGVALLMIAYFGFDFFSAQPTSRTPDVASLAPEFINANGFASVLSPTQSITVGPQGGDLSLAGGAQVSVPAGAFPTTTRLHAAILDLVPQRLSPDLQQAWTYVIATDDDFEHLAQPVVLEVPQPADRVVVAVSDSSGTATWRRIHIPPGPTTRVEIHHFSVVKIVIGIAIVAVAADQIFNISGSLLAAMEGLQHYTARTNQAINEVDGPPPDRLRIEQAEDLNMTQAFFGVDEHASQSAAQLCAEFKAVLRDFNAPENLALPAQFKGQTVGSRGSWLTDRIGRFFRGKDISAKNDLTQFLQAANSPATIGGIFYELVEPSMDRIRDRLLAQRQQISPAQFLRISIEENDNNVPLGILAAHNFLKDITYRGRDTYDHLGPGDHMTEFGLPASKLQSWRQDSNIKPSIGTYDKMGPVYHVFAAMTAGYWLPSLVGGNVDNFEAFLRTFRIGSDQPDAGEGRADECGVEIGQWAYNELSKLHRSEARPDPGSGDPFGTMNAWQTRMMCRDGTVTGETCQKADQTLCQAGKLTGSQCDRYM